MAFNEGQISLRVKFQDNTANTYTKSYTLNPNHPDCADLATIASAAGKTNLDAIMPILENVTKAKVLSYVVGQEFASDAAGNGAGDWDDKAIISVLIDAPDQPGKRGNIYVQAPDDGIFVGDAAFGPESEDIDPADNALQVFLALYQSTEVDDDLAPGGVFLFSDGEQMKDAPGAKGRKH